MQPSNPKRVTILNNIKRSLKKENKKPFPKIDEIDWLPQFNEDIVIEFAKQFICNGGFFHYAPSSEVFFNEIMLLTEEQEWKYVYCWEEELYEYWHNMGLTVIKTAKKPYNISAAVVRCEALVAQNGKIILTNKQKGALYFAQNAPTLIIMANASQVFANRIDAFTHIRTIHANTPYKQILEIAGNQYQHPFYDLANANLGAKKIIVYLVDEVFDLF